MLEYGTVVSADAANRSRLIRAVVSEACWGEAGYEAVLWVSGSHVKQECLEVQSGCSSCVKLDVSRTIILSTMTYGLKAALSRALDRSM